LEISGGSNFLSVEPMYKYPTTISLLSKPKERETSLLKARNPVLQIAEYPRE
jgi:hypothetical protein